MSSRGLALILAIACVCVPVLGQTADAGQAKRQAQRISQQNWLLKGRGIQGFSAAVLRQAAIRQKLQLRTQGRTRSTFNAAVGAGWTSLGPLPLPSDASGTGLQNYGWVSGRATAVAIDPNDSTGNTVFAGSAYGGVWKSTNAGNLSLDPSSVSWVPLTDAQPTLAVGAIAIQPQASNPDPSRSIVLVGTGETNSSADSYYGLGFLRSTDGGQSWALISQDATGTHSFAGLGFSQIAFSTANPNVVVAATGSASQGIIEGLESPLAVSRGLYFSADAGLTWQQASITDSGATVSAASVTSVQFNAAAGKFYAAVRFHGFYTSSDGANWTRLTSQPGTALSSSVCPSQATQPSACPVYRGEIAVVPGRAGSTGLGEMYVWYVDANDADQGIWISSSGGISWTQINDSGITNCGDLFGGCGTTQGGYNLALAAVPNGTATDLYAGATNLYKCTITNAYPTCNGTGQNAFFNLTHVYGCSDIAKVHPDQHAIDFLVSNGTALLYFANDGGIYRALDGFMGLRAGTCGLSNQFDNLNATLGPITQFVSVAESASDANVLFGGAQGNGAPATASAGNGGPWANVSAGDVGFTVVNPANDQEWFLAMPPDGFSGVNIFRCASGANCHTQDFQNDQIVSGNLVGGDVGAFYLPFILDPATPTSLLMGTCRVWRGPTSGGAYTVLSANLETGGTSACSGTETNMVRAIVAGGPVDTSGFSQVIYAGTDGEGPLIASPAQGGHVWVTTASDSGPASWSDRTGNINAQAFPISSIVIDSADPTGQTAYAAIMGFHISHVWKTSNAGISWTDFSANLPDAPANALEINPGTSTNNGTLYVGTDVGVFASSTTSPNWSEVGPPVGQSGFLPNVAVTSLKIFNSGGTKSLRAATYGRGIWEWNLVTTPDFQITVSGSPQTVFAGQTASFSGIIYSRNGYNSSVNLSCTTGSSGAPQTCVAAPALVSPTGNGASFSLSASGTAGDYSFNLQAIGTDPAAVTHTSPIMLQVVDFGLGAPSPPSVTVTPGSSSTPISLTVSAAGSFSGMVTLSCSGLTAGVSCQFQPSTAMPTSGSPVNVALMVSTSGTTPLGTSQITITATSAGGPSRSQSFSLTVTAVPDFTISISNPSLTAQVNSTATFNGTIAAVNGYNSSVALNCGAGAPLTCIVSPANITPASGGTAFSVNVGSNVSQSYTFNVIASGSDAASTTHIAPVTFTAMPAQDFDFSFSSTPSSLAVSRGKTAVYTLSLSSNTGTFPSNATLACSGLPALATCSFNPTQVSSGSGSASLTLSIATTAPSARVAESFATLPFAIALLLPYGVLRRRKHLALYMLLLITLVSPGCGGGLQGNGTVGGGSGNPGTPAGTYTVTVTATCGSTAHTIPVVITVNP